MSSHYRIAEYSRIYWQYNCKLFVEMILYRHWKTTLKITNRYKIIIEVIPIPFIAFIGNLALCWWQYNCQPFIEIIHSLADDYRHCKTTWKIINRCKIIIDSRVPNWIGDSNSVNRIKWECGIESHSQLHYLNFIMEFDSNSWTTDNKSYSILNWIWFRIRFQFR